MSTEYFLGLSEGTDKQFVGQCFLLPKSVLQYKENRTVYVGYVSDIPDVDEQLPYTIDIKEVIFS